MKILLRFLQHFYQVFQRKHLENILAILHLQQNTEHLQNNLRFRCRPISTAGSDCVKRQRAIDQASKEPVAMIRLMHVDDSNRRLRQVIVVTTHQLAPTPSVVSLPAVIRRLTGS